MNKYPEHIMKTLREREGLEYNDTSMDEELNKLSPNEAFKEVCAWNGFLGGWDSTFRGWIEDIYKITLDENKNYYQRFHVGMQVKCVPKVDNVGAYGKIGMIGEICSDKTSGLGIDLVGETGVWLRPDEVEIL